LYIWYRITPHCSYMGCTTLYGDATHCTQGVPGGQVLFLRVGKKNKNSKKKRVCPPCISLLRCQMIPRYPPKSRIQDGYWRNSKLMYYIVICKRLHQKCYHWQRQYVTTLVPPNLFHTHSSTRTLCLFLSFHIPYQPSSEVTIAVQVAMDISFLLSSRLLCENESLYTMHLIASVAVLHWGQILRDNVDARAPPPCRLRLSPPM